MSNILSALLFLSLVSSSLAARANPPLLLRDPAVSQTQIAFEYANDLWIVSRDGGEARRLTTGVGREFNPHFSPDGTQIAFSGEYDGNIDVYVLSASGGVPRRLTYHPGADVAIGWTPDGTRILFRSSRDSYADSNQLYTMPLDGSASGNAAAPDCRRWILFSEWLAHCLRSRVSLAGGLEEISRGTDDKDLDREPVRLEDRQGST